MKELAKLRKQKGLSQRALAQEAGVAPATVYELEAGRREPNPSTLRKLADALEVEVMELTREATKVEVEVGYEDDGVYRGEILRFTGELVDSYEEGGDTRVELYRCPDGYRVYVDDGSEPVRELHPSEVDRNTGEVEYPLYSAQEVAEAWPRFGSTVGELRIRDID